jgi:hypothetical protein
VEDDPVIYREEVTGILFTVADINLRVGRILRLLEESSVAKGKYRKTTPEERARWRENEERMARILERITREEGMTLERALRVLQNPR